ncbi:MAG: hypothetical protein LBR08_01075, partial [Bacteroidales bacterium]|nr:hypothetical protein [Bacteroidales bacterium]
VRGEREQVFGLHHFKQWYSDSQQTKHIAPKDENQANHASQQREKVRANNLGIEPGTARVVKLFSMGKMPQAGTKP